MSRREFSKATKRDAFLRATGRCEDCGQKILGTPEYDHVLEAFIGGEPTLENCRVLCARCHKAKTGSRRKEIDKTRRTFEKRINARSRRQGFRGWRKFDGTLVLR